MTQRKSIKARPTAKNSRRPKAGKKKNQQKRHVQLSRMSRNKGSLTLNSIENYDGHSQMAISYVPTQVSGVWVDYGQAPAHQDAGGRTGLRFSVAFRPWSLARDSSDATMCFADATNSFSCLGACPLLIINYTMERLLGNSSANNVVKLFRKYALRSLEVHYVPSGGLSETGAFAMLWQDDLEYSLNTWQKVTNSQGSSIGAFNKEFNYVAIPARKLNQPANKLYNIDPTTDASTRKIACSPGQLIAVSADLQLSSKKIMGDLVIKATYDLYQLSGDASPTTMVIEQQSTASSVNAESKEAKVETAFPVVLAASTSNATTALAPSSNSVSEKFVVVRPKANNPRQ